MLIGGLLGGVMLAMLVAVGIDLRSGKLHQPRQIGRQLALPILGEVWLE